MEQTDIDVIIITYNSERFIGPCIDSLSRSRTRLFVVDNGSFDQTTEYVREKYPQVTVIENRTNLGYSGAVNLGSSLVSTSVVVVCNADVVFQEGSLEKLVAYVCEHTTVGAAGPQLVFPDGSWQGSYADVPATISEEMKRLTGLTSLRNWLRRLAWPRKLDRSPKEVGFVMGAVIAMRRAAFEAVGGWDESFHFYAEDADFCNRLHKAGWRVMFVPSAEVVHVGGASSTRVNPSDRYLRQLVDSKLLLLRKNIPGWQVWLCKRLEKLSSRLMLLGWRLVEQMGSRHTREYASSRALAFEHLVQIWGELCQQGEP